MVYSREKAAQNAEKSNSNVPGTCQMWTRLKYDAPSAGDRDHDGDADAVDGWKSETKVHPGDRNPPRGVPVAFSGGSKGYGHRAISLGGGKIRSTDMRADGYQAGHVGTTTIAQIERSMGVHYLGWSETITGQKIPTPRTTPPPPKPPVQQVSFVLDVSHHQFDNGFKLKMAWDQGFRHVILKCTQGMGYVDPKYKAALAEAKKLGFKVSVYHFLEHGNAAKQAENLAKNIVDKGLPVWIDVEPTREKTPDESLPTLRDWVGFRDAATKLGLRVVGKYLTESYWERLKKPFLAGKLDLWRAAYPKSTRGYASKLYPGNNHERWNSFGGQKPSLWQFTQNARINGYSGGVDVSAYRGSHAELDREGWFKLVNVGDASTTPPKEPVVKPTPAPKPKPVDKDVDFKVFLVPHNSHARNAAADVKSSMALVKGDAGANAVVFNTELDPSTLRHAASDGLGPSFEWHFDNENAMAHGSNWTDVERGSVMTLAKADPSLAGVSPARKLNDLFLGHEKVTAVRVAFLGSHWTSEANCIHTKVKGRAWREKTWAIQREDTFKEVERVLALGYAVVLAGDFNTGKYFTAKQLFESLNKRVGGKAVLVHGGTLDSVIAISSDKVKLTEIGAETMVHNASDHDAVVAKIKATVL